MTAPPLDQDALRVATDAMTAAYFGDARLANAADRKASRACVTAYLEQAGDGSQMSLGSTAGGGSEAPDV